MTNATPVRHCARCLYPVTHPFGLVLDDDGVCSGCRVHEEKDTLDWNARAAQLRRLLKSSSSTKGSRYDCVVPVTGARDSYFIVHTLKREFDLNPLLVTYNKHYTTPRGHRNLAYLRTIFDCDLYQMMVSTRTVKALTRATVERRGSIYWHVLAGQTVLPVQIAARYKIPLVVWGHHQGLDQVGMYSHLDDVEMSRRYRKDHDLMGLEAEDLVSGDSGLAEEELMSFFYPDDSEIARVGVRGIYLGNFLRWDTKAQHERMIDLYGYETAALPRTFDAYNDVDCAHYARLHDHIKYLKHGYGKATDHACREIRFGRITRSEGAALARRFEAVLPDDVETFCRWLDIDAKWLYEAVDRHRDPRVWRRAEDGTWQRAYPEDTADAAAIERAATRYVGDCQFRTTPSRDPESDAAHRSKLLMRGWNDAHPALGVANVK